MERLKKISYRLLKTVCRGSVVSLLVFAVCNSEDVKQLSIGNLALPSTQQPSPTFSFGQNIIDKNDTILDQRLTQYKAPNMDFLQTSSNIFYGITDKFVFVAGVPYILRFKQGNQKSSGLGDVFLDMEYAFYQYQTKTATNQMTIVGSASLDTAAQGKRPSLRTSPTSIFIGTTASHLAVDWYLFTSYGIWLPVSRAPTLLGTQFLYEYGIGHNLGNPFGGILLGLLEINGVYTELNNATSKTNILFVGPSLFFSTKHLTIQAGIQWVTAQTATNPQDRVSWRAVFSIGYTIYG